MTNAQCTPDAILRQVAIEDFMLRPDGQEILYVRRHIEGIEYLSHIWSTSLDGSAPRQLTRGALRDSSPAYAPDGKQLAFVRSPHGADSGQVWVMSLNGSEPRQVTRLPHGASSVSWSPDGRLLAVVAPSPDDRPYIVEPEVPGKEPVARRIRRVDWRDDDGHRDRRAHLFLVPVDAQNEPRQLTSGDWDVTNPAWSPDGRSIAFAADRRSDGDLDPRTSIWIVAVDSGEVRELAALGGDADFPSFSPDGQRVAFLGRDVADAAEYVAHRPWLIAADGGAPEPLEISSEGLIGTWAWTELDLMDGSPGPHWLDDRTLVVLLAERARCVPYAVAVDGSSQQRMVTQDRVLASGLSVAAGRVTFGAAIDGRAAEVYAAQPNGSSARVTRDGSSWQDELAQPVLDEVEIPGPGGSINTWIASPREAANRVLPTIMHFHGGPTGSFGPGSSMDAMVLASAGYRVVMPNIRGSATFGYDWAHALSGRWGDVDAQDALAVTDWLVGRGLAEEGRIGLYGLSYGGFLVQWLIGVTDRYSAAVGENGVANQVSAWSNSYFGVHWNRRMGLADPLAHEGMLKLWSSSPLSNVANIHTPLLMLQAEEDAVCPPADNEQLFSALRALGREVEYVLYPEEHHEFKVYGRPDRRVDRHQRMLDWFGRYL